MGIDHHFPRFEVLRDDVRCIQCNQCQTQCPNGVFASSDSKGKPRIREQECVNCQRCAAFCPTEALKIIPARCRLCENAVWSDQTIRHIHQQAATGSVLLASCGNPHMDPDYFAHLALYGAQVTTSPIDPLREPPQLQTQLGRKARLSLQTPFLFAAMSFGSLSFPAQESMAMAAQNLGTYWNSGEGGWHPRLLPMADHTIVQVASGRFGVSSAVLNQAAAIEIKFGQGGKPGIGGHLPAEKVTEEVAALRQIPAGTDAISPAPHHDIHCMEDIYQLITTLKEVTGHRKPILVKVAAVHNIGQIACALAQSEADILCIDGSHGGTGAAPMDFRDHVGIPLPLALAAADHALRQNGLRQNLSILASGSIRGAADAAKAIALGADACYIGTAALLALGCRLCRSCHKGRCAWGIATQEPALVSRLDSTVGQQRLTNLVEGWSYGLAELLGGMGLSSIEQLRGNRQMLRGIGLHETELNILGVSHAGT